MSPESAHPHTAAGRVMPRLSWPILGAAGAILAAAWAVTLATSADFNALMMVELGGGAPSDTVTYVALSAVMMVAMMLPSALPMVEAHRGIVKLDQGAREALVQSVLFSLAYFAVWTAMTALSLPILLGFGIMGAMGGPAALAPGAVLVAAGAYQFTKWKDFCLKHCRSPIGFITAHYRKGRAGALRMGFSHASYCLGCCWLLMLVWFVAGAMSVLWMGVFAAFILAEKVWSRGMLLSRVMGATAIFAGAVLLYFGAAAPAM